MQCSGWDRLVKNNRLAFFTNPFNSFHETKNPLAGQVGWWPYRKKSLLPGQHIAFIGDWQLRTGYRSTVRRPAESLKPGSTGSTSRGNFWVSGGNLGRNFQCAVQFFTHILKNLKKKILIYAFSLQFYDGKFTGFGGKCSLSNCARGKVWYF